MAEEDDDRAWWRYSRRLARKAIVFGLGISLVPAAIEGWLNRATFFGMPFGGFFLAVVTPLAIAAAIFWFADRQHALDRALRPFDD
jgi:putative solute:sodium symporter small subunit